MDFNDILDRLRLKNAGPYGPRELAQLGYMEWLAALPCNSGFNEQAMLAYRRALPLRRAEPAIAIFCELLIDATRAPIAPLDLSLPNAHRRGGAKARRRVH